MSSEGGEKEGSLEATLSNASMSQIPAENHSQAQALLQTLNGLRAKEHDIDEKTKEKDRELKVAQDRRDRLKALKAETSELQRKFQESSTFVSMAKEVVKEFPGDTQILRLERRLETLQGEVKDADRALKSCRTLVDAYQSKIKAIQLSKERLLGELQGLVNDTCEEVQAETETHSSVVGIAPQDAIAVLTDICNTREKELDLLNKQLDEKVTRDRELTTQLKELQDTINEEIPRVEEEKNRDIEEIMAEWENEKRHLLQVYGKLCVINREQNYHLQRGTHIKRAPTKPVVDPNESRLTLAGNELAKEINNLREKLKFSEEETAALRTVHTQLKKQCEQEQRAFNNEKAKAVDSFKQSQTTRKQLQTEQMELRKLKGELTQLLNSLRDSQAQVQRAAVANAVAMSVSPQRQAAIEGTPTSAI